MYSAESHGSMMGLKISKQPMFLGRQSLI